MLNRGCYQQPQSGVGMEFSPLSGPVRETQIVLHETGYLTKNDWWHFPNTISPFWRFYYNATPGHKVIFADCEITLGPEHVVIIPDRQIFHSHGTEAVRHFWLTFTIGVLPQKSEPIVLPADPELIDRVDRICGLFTGVGEGDRFAIYHESMALLYQSVLRMRPYLQESLRSAVLETVVGHVQNHLQEPLDIPALAKLAGLTPRSLAAHFRKEYHCTPAHFVMQMRIREAARLLAATPLTIDEIAFAVGFADRFYLTRVFSRMVGKSPAKFRREYKNHE
ncbi:AraC family transcriptional regulator [Luteolibacter arcticus]|uniref:AraC family transcriptional regulator n=1 Tax=Luteolibacter arcticus TaxID=1581411 RepID=A0ABT3GK46_9BACT|nr:AraC family transcriptional regulator [Luteolibacter arcticus]